MVSVKNLSVFQVMMMDRPGRSIVRKVGIMIDKLTAKQQALSLHAEMTGTLMAVVETMDDLLEDVSNAEGPDDLEKLEIKLHSNREVFSEALDKVFNQAFSVLKGATEEDVEAVLHNAIDRILKGIRDRAKNKVVNKMNEEVYKNLMVKLVDEYFGLHFSQHEALEAFAGANARGVWFLPEAVLDLVPKEFHDRFIEANKNFSNDFCHVINNGLPEVIEADDEDEMRAIMKKKYKKFKKEFKEQYGMSLKKKFLQYLLESVDPKQPLRCSDIALKIRGQGLVVDLI